MKEEAGNKEKDEAVHQKFSVIGELKKQKTNEVVSCSLSGVIIWSEFNINGSMTDRLMN